MNTSRPDRLRVGLALFALVALGTLFALTRNKSNPPQPAQPQAAAPQFQHGIDISQMDRTTAADGTTKVGIDFYRFCNGAWLDRTIIPNDRPAWGPDYILQEEAQKTLRGILEREAAKGGGRPASNEQKIGDFWAAGMDEKAIDAARAKPLARQFDRIAGIKTKDDLARVVAELHLNGSNALFGFGAGADFQNSSMVIGQAAQSGLGLPNRDYYTKADDKSKETKAKYVAHIAAMFELLGDSKQEAMAAATDVMDIETQLAQVSMTNSQMREPENVYHKMSPAEWAKLMPDFDLPRYLRYLGLVDLKEVNVAQPEFFKGLNTTIAKTPTAKMVSYLRWRLLSSAAPYLSSDFVLENFAFNQKYLRGSDMLAPRWRRVVQAADAALGEAVGQIYVRENFPPQAKEQALRLVGNIKAAFHDSIANLDWMSDATKARALVKLDVMEVKIGYPDVWIDYTDLQIDRRSYVGNMQAASRFASLMELKRIGKPVDRNRWEMTPQTVNAYYEPTLNVMVFPAAILQPPYFDPLADEAFNYGAIGATIGHEMTHGFDDEGSQFDEAGNLKNWWTDADKANFQSRIALIREQFSTFKVEGEGGEQTKGDLVSGEAAADLGGLKLAYAAMQKALAGKPRKKDANGYTEEQRFFIAFGQSWAVKARFAHEQLQVANDPHPLPRFRVNGTVANMPEFVRAFGLRDNSPIMLPPAKRCRLW